GWIPEVSDEGVTEVAGLYLCGDGCGIRGAEAAALQGRMTGLRVARDLGHAAPTPSPRAWQRAERFGRAMTALSTPSPEVQALTTIDTVVCRCESLTRADILAEIDSGAASTNAVKSGLRAAMGPCGGAYCQTAISGLIAARTGQPLSDIPPPTARPPLRPIPLGQAAGAIDYDDLPIPKPAPL
ncbi:MAG: (2Fe-2S)-binding protein, partial [Rhodobacteraceae bacterium]|nr:(2Fe-2S)-binding protein [Paracoccaceae bacterium]